MNESEAEGVWTVMESGASDSGANAFEEGQKQKSRRGDTTMVLRRSIQP